ncbi:MAG: sulfite reductase subunit alpha [Verrucomicrobiota bacterium]|nr:sulfite reductase subunit alpha [Verrucomicrobiota bacterium]
MSTTASHQPYDLNNPFLATLREYRLLNHAESEKETSHIVIDISGSGLSYNCGDSLGVYSTNRIEDVNHVLTALGASGEELVTLPKKDAPLTLRDALTSHLYFLAGPTKKLLTALKDKAFTPAEKARLEQLLDAEHAEATEKYFSVRHFADILEDFPGSRLTPQEFVAQCRRLSPRLYSIASSPTRYPQEVHLTVAAVRYQTLNRDRVGVASTWLSDRVPPFEAIVPVFVASSHFRLPANPDTDIIMVGPGTGVAPFRSFLQEREETKATGRNWLFFGAQRARMDYLYEEEFESMRASGHLTHLSLAWSRDQAKKVYVQDRMRENAAELWSWIKNGACFYVCGDKERMAKDVDAALHDIIATQGGMSPEAAVDFVKQLKKDKRYQRDVY